MSQQDDSDRETLIDQTIDLDGTEDDLQRVAPLLNPLLAKVVAVRVERESGELLPTERNHDRAFLQGGWTRSR